MHFTFCAILALYRQEFCSSVLYIGGAGNLKVTTVAGDTVTFNALNAGTFFPVQVKKVFDTGTSASNIVALW